MGGCVYIVPVFGLTLRPSAVLYTPGITWPVFTKNVLCFKNSSTVHLACPGLCSSIWSTVQPDSLAKAQWVVDVITYSAI